MQNFSKILWWNQIPWDSNFLLTWGFVCRLQPSVGVPWSLCFLKCQQISECSKYVSNLKHLFFASSTQGWLSKQNEWVLSGYFSRNPCTQICFANVCCAYFPGIVHNKIPSWWITNNIILVLSRSVRERQCSPRVLDDTGLQWSVT